MLERRRASVQSLLDDVVLVAQELLQDARPPDVTRESLACRVRRTTPSIGVAETEDCAFGHRAMLWHHRVGCDLVTFLDEYVLDTPLLRAFITAVRLSISAAASPEDACDAIRPRFAELLADSAWLPEEYRRSAPARGTGGGIGRWLLFRAGDRSLSLFSLVLPPGAGTPVHDHLAWGRQLLRSRLLAGRAPDHLRCTRVP